MEVPLNSLPLGSRFGLLLETTGRVLRGKLISVSCASAFVEWDSAPQTVEIHSLDGSERTFQAAVKRREHISLQTPVIPQMSNAEYNERIVR
jgi:hypothetical protein